MGTDLGVLADQAILLANPDRWDIEQPRFGRRLELKRFGEVWWMATEVEGADLSVVWKGNDNGLWEVMPGWNAEGLLYGGMDAGDWILDDDGGRAEGLIVASCCQAWGWDTLGIAVTPWAELPTFTEVRDVAIAPNESEGRVWLAGSVGGLVTWVPQPSATSAPTRTNRPTGPQTSRSKDGLLERQLVGGFRGSESLVDAAVQFRRHVPVQRWDMDVAGVA